MNKPLVVFLSAILAIGVFSPAAAITENDLSINGSSNQKEIIKAGQQFQYGGVSIRWYLSEAIKLNSSDTVIYIDPIEVHEVEEPADYIIITHAHEPHYSQVDIKKLIKDGTVIIGSPQTNNNYTAKPGDTLTFNKVSFEFVPAYNIDKFRPTGEPYHPLDDLGIGVIVDFGTVRIYHAGDTDRIPEMVSIVADIAILPVCGVICMDAAEAAQAVEDLKISSDLKYAIPFHYGYNGVTDYRATIQDAETFSELANCSVVILDSIDIWYPHELAAPDITYPTTGTVVWGKVTITWEANDAWEHFPFYRIEYSSDGGTTWNRIAPFETNNSYEWDTTAVQDGTDYMIRVTATCREEVQVVLTEEGTSGKFTVNNTNPPTTPGLSVIDLLIPVVAIILIIKKK